MEGYRLLIIGSDGSVQHFDTIDDICQAFPVQPFQVRKALRDYSGDTDEGWIWTEKGDTIVDYFVDIEAGSEEQPELF